MTRVTLSLCLLVACDAPPPADRADTDPADTDGDTDVTVLPEVGTLVQQLQVGDCGAPVYASVWVERFTLLEDCAAPHRFEVAGRFTTDHPAHPGHAALLREGHERCLPIFEGYVGKAYWDSQYDLTTISPSPSSWAGGDRDVVCLVKTVDRTLLTEKVQGSAR